MIVLVGSVTAFFAATSGLVQNDIKRIVAFSTISQLGYTLIFNLLHMFVTILYLSLILKLLFILLIFLLLLFFNLCPALQLWQGKGKICLFYIYNKYFLSLRLAPKFKGLRRPGFTSSNNIRIGMLRRNFSTRVNSLDP